jgi:hypothetical protein
MANEMDSEVTGTAWQNGGITIDLTPAVIERWDVGKVVAVLAHEMVHAFDMYAETLFYDWNIPGEGFIQWLNDPEEREAMYGQILELVNSGYSDREVMAIMIDEFRVEFDELYREDYEIEEAYPLFRKVVRELLRQIRRSEDVLV